MSASFRKSVTVFFVAVLLASALGIGTVNVMPVHAAAPGCINYPPGEMHDQYDPPQCPPTATQTPTQSPQRVRGNQFQPQPATPGEASTQSSRRGNRFQPQPNVPQDPPVFCVGGGSCNGTPSGNTGKPLPDQRLSITISKQGKVCAKDLAHELGINYVQGLGGGLIFIAGAADLPWVAIGVGVILGELELLDNIRTVEDLINAKGNFGKILAALSDVKSPIPSSCVIFASGTPFP